MRSVNKVMIIGNLTRDPEVRKTGSGQMITTFGVATNREWVGHDNQKKSLAEFHSIVVWGRLAELCVDLLHKGDLVYIEGYLKTRTWDHESGIKIKNTEIVCRDMIKLSHKRENSDDDSSESSETKDTSDDMSPSENYDDDDFFADIDSDEEDTSDNETS